MKKKKTGFVKLLLILGMVLPVVFTIGMIFVSSFKCSINPIPSQVGFSWGFCTFCGLTSLYVIWQLCSYFKKVSEEQKAMKEEESIKKRISNMSSIEEALDILESWAISDNPKLINEIREIMGKLRTFLSKEVNAKKLLTANNKDETFGSFSSVCTDARSIILSWAKEVLNLLIVFDDESVEVSGDELKSYQERLKALSQNMAEAIGSFDDHVNVLVAKINNKLGQSADNISESLRLFTQKYGEVTGISPQNAMHGSEGDNQ